MKTFVVIPTYNESENISKLIKEITDLNLGIEIAIVDDDSPDGTWKLVKDMIPQYPNIHCVRRCGQKGRGSAGITGFKYALENQADYIIEMDADFSHHPSYIPTMLDQIKNFDVVIGSRFLKKGADKRGFIRHSITIFANFYIRQILKIKIKDCTSGYRCFKRKVLESINLDNTVSLGPSIVQEFLYKAYLMGFTIGEIPIVFVDREYGTSTFNRRIMLEGFLMVLVLRFLFSKIRSAPQQVTNTTKTLIYKKD